MNVLLIHPGSGKLEIAEGNFLTTGAFLPPLGLLYLSSVLEINGHKPEVIDCTADKHHIETIKKKIKSFDVVGLTTYCQTFELNRSIKISKIIKECDQDIPIVIGGPHSTLLPKQSINEHNADICVSGNGSYVINQIIDAIAGKRELSTIPDIFYRRKSQIRNTKSIRKKNENIDSYPFPARNLVEKYDYGHMLGVKITEGKLTSILTSQGCMNRCRFCNLYAHIPKFIGRKIQNIKNEISDIVAKGYKTIVFVDDNFMAQKYRVEQIMDFIIKNKFDVNIWIFGARADNAERGLWEKMRDAGVELMNFGLESGNQKILDYYNKKLTLDEMRKAISLSKEMGFFTQTNFIIGSPLENKKTIADTIKFAKSIPTDLSIFYLFTYTYKSWIWKDAVIKGKIKPDEYRALPDKDRGLGNFTHDELMDYIETANKKFYYNPNYWLRELKWIIKNKKFRYLKLGLKLIRSI